MARKFIMVKEAAAKIGKSTTTLHSLRERKLFPDPTTNIPGGRRGYYEDDMEQWDAAKDKRAVAAEINARYEAALTDGKLVRNDDDKFTISWGKHRAKFGVSEIRELEKVSPAIIADHIHSGIEGLIWAVKRDVTEEN